MGSSLTEPNIPLDMSCHRFQRELWPGRWCHKWREGVETAQKFGVVKGVWRLISSNSLPILRPVPIVCLVCGSCKEHPIEEKVTVYPRSHSYPTEISLKFNLGTSYVSDNLRLGKETEPLWLTFIREPSACV